MKNPIPATQVVCATKGTVFTSAFHLHARVGDHYELIRPVLQITRRAGWRRKYGILSSLTSSLQKMRKGVEKPIAKNVSCR
jgi:hypothetical protein